jgi:uncharacterized glyoxalase superfamily protein PhnB
LNKAAGAQEVTDFIANAAATIEYEVADPDAVKAACLELTAAGHTMIHDTRTEPWGQVVARLLGPEGLLIGISYAPWLWFSAPRRR